jgi:hypothetical protein
VILPDVNGWVVWAEANASNIGGVTAYDWIQAKFTVPPNPTAGGHLLYYFISLETAGGDILQPVLQWGNSNRFGGQYWTIAAWYVNTQESAPRLVRDVRTHVARPSGRPPSRNRTPGDDESGDTPSRR